MDLETAAAVLEELRRQVRGIRGYSQRQLAKEIGWSSSSLNRWWNGENAVVSPEIARRMARLPKASSSADARYEAAARVLLEARRFGPAPASPRSSTTPTGINWKEELIQWIHAMLLERNWSRAKAADEVGMHRGKFNRLLTGASTPYPETVERIIRRLEASEEVTKHWVTGAAEHWQVQRRGVRQSVGKIDMVCPVCGERRRVKPSELRARKRSWTCSVHCSRLVTFLPPEPMPTPGNRAVFVELRRIGLKAFMQKTRLKRYAVRRLCTDPQVTPTTSTLEKLTAAGYPKLAGLFPTTAADTSREHIRSFHDSLAADPAKRKRVLGKGGQTRKGQHYPKLSEAQRKTSQQKMQADPDYGRRIAQRLARGQDQHWRALHLLFGHLPRGAGGVFRSRQEITPADEVSDAQLREWAAVDARRSGIARSYLVLAWKRWLGLAATRGGRPRLDARERLVSACYAQGLSLVERAKKVSEQEGTRISPESLGRWERRQLNLTRRTKTLRSSSPAS